MSLVVDAGSERTRQPRSRLTEAASSAGANGFARNAWRGSSRNVSDSAVKAPPWPWGQRSG
jgi:hypothetical protein